MSSIIIDPNGAGNSGLKQAHHPYWDAPITRREVQQAVNDIAENENALQNMCDTSNIVLNLVCEKLNITRAEIDVFAERKKAEIAAFIEAKQKEAEANNAQPNA
jgi:hypothetical protein